MRWLALLLVGCSTSYLTVTIDASKVSSPLLHGDIDLSVSLLENGKSMRTHDFTVAGSALHNSSFWVELDGHPAGIAIKVDAYDASHSLIASATSAIVTWEPADVTVFLCSSGCTPGDDAGNPPPNDLIGAPPEDLANAGDMAAANQGPDLQPSAGMVTLNPVADTYIEDNSDSPHGTLGFVSVENGAGLGRPQQVGLLQFDLSSLGKVQIDQVELTLWVTNDGNAALYGAKRAWSESATWLNPVASASWNAPNDVFDPAHAVATPFYAPISMTSPFSISGPGGSSFVKLVQSWVDTPATNFGLAIGDQGNHSVYNSREASSNPPQLVVHYHVGP
jgi:hypothetical protein